MTEYVFRKHLIESVQAHALEQGYAVTIHYSNSIFNIIHLECDRGGMYCYRNGLNETNRLRDAGSRLNNCPFAICGPEKDGTWTVKIRNSEQP
jgi:hypothetical protein